MALVRLWQQRGMEVERQHLMNNSHIQMYIVTSSEMVTFHTHMHARAPSTCAHTHAQTHECMHTHTNTTHAHTQAHTHHKHTQTHLYTHTVRHYHVQRISQTELATCMNSAEIDLAKAKSTNLRCVPPHYRGMHTFPHYSYIA